MSTELTIKSELDRFSRLEPWKRELAEFVMEAFRTGHDIQCKYQGFTMTPAALARQLCAGSFVWGVVNWKMIPRQAKTDWGNSADWEGWRP